MQVRPSVYTAMALAGVLVLTTHAGAVVRVDKSGISGPIDPAGGRGQAQGEQTGDHAGSDEHGGDGEPLKKGSQPAFF